MFIGVPKGDGSIVLRLLPKLNWWQRLIKAITGYMATFIKWGVWALIWYYVGSLGAI
jgi:hypothetical protein